MVRKFNGSGTLGAFPLVATSATVARGDLERLFVGMQNGRYQIVETIGTGATSFVTKAQDTLIGRTVALKTLHGGFAETGSTEQFLREARIVGQLSHPSIVGLFDVGIEEKGTPYLVMEYVSGKTLESVLADGPLVFQKACAWGADLASALARAHQAGIIHGDVKPANILVTEEGRVKLGDFGIARFTAQVSSSGRIMGTPAYLSPEQIAGAPQDSRSDLFSLAIVIYQMVTGERPFDGTSLEAVCAQILHNKPALPSRRNPAIPAAFDRIVLRCLAKDPADRYASGDELASHLYPFARRSAGSAAPAGARRLPLVLLRRMAWATGAAAVLAAATVPAVRHLQESWRIPPAPVSLVAAPKAPADLGDSPKEVEIASVMPSASLSNLPSASSEKKKGKVEHHRRSPARPKRSQAPLLFARADTPLGPLPAFAPSPTFPQALSAQSRRVALRIEIQAQASDGTLAIFADRELLSTTRLEGSNPREPLRLERALSPGAHQLRVALYRADKSLQTEKEGLAEIRDDGENRLAIRVARRTKFLLKRDTALEVTWPSADAAASAESSPRTVSASSPAK